MPIRIVLAVAVVFLAAWFTVLRPGEVEIPADPAGSVSSKAGEFAAKAEAGAATAEKDAAGAANATLEDDAAAPATAVAPAPSGTTTAAPSGTATTTQAAPAPLSPLAKKELAKLPPSIRGALKERKILVLGVLNTEAKPWAPMADDDREVAKALRDVNRYRGQVVVRTAPVAKLARYEGLLGALAVRQTPTIVVVDRNRRALAVTGYLDTKSVNQAIADARANSTEVMIKDDFLAKVNAECGRDNVRLERVSFPTVRGAWPKFFDRVAASQAKTRRAIAALPAPAKWRSLKRQMIVSLRSVEAMATRMSRAAKSRKRSEIRAAYLAIVTSSQADLRALDRRFNTVGLTSCAINRTQ
jgi:hypothetical protein